MPPMFSIQPSAAFAAVSSSGVCTASGSTTLVVGRVVLKVGAISTATA